MPIRAVTFKSLCQKNGGYLKLASGLALGASYRVRSPALGGMFRSVLIFCHLKAPISELHTPEREAGPGMRQRRKERVSGRVHTQHDENDAEPDIAASATMNDDICPMTSATAIPKGWVGIRIAIRVRVVIAKG